MEDEMEVDVGRLTELAALRKSAFLHWKPGGHR